jgi:hypothetical protein
MSNKMAVKVKTDKVIKALEEALKIRDKKLADSKKAQADYETAMKKWNDDLKKLAKSPKAKITEVNTFHRWHSSKSATEQELSVTITVPSSLFPKEPENKSNYHERTYKDEVEEINNALRLLRMTDQEYVSASTMKSVSQYL